ncbi:ATP-binding protein [Jannaschia marina]|nr:ATP-binding protein [Jannaschia marina]
MGETAQILRQLRVGSALLLLGALALGGLAIWIGGGVPDRLLLTGALALAAAFALVHLFGGWIATRDARRLGIIMEFLEHDSAPGFCTSADGVVLSQNQAARDRFGVQKGVTMTRALEPLFANPDAVVHRLRLSAEGGASAREDVVTRRGHLRVAVHRIEGGFLWRLEDLAERPRRTADGIGLPILTFGPSGTILFMNEVLRAAAGRRVTRLRDLFEDLPLVHGGLNRLLTKDGAQTVRVVVSEPVNGRQEVFVLPVEETHEDLVALDTLPVALLRLDPDGTVLFANRLARELLPAMVDDGEKRLAALVEGLGRGVREWVSEAAAGRGLYRAEVVRVTGAEVDTYLQITLGRPLIEGETGLIAVLHDATELKTLEAQFVQSQKMQAIGQLAGGVAHDFNNLLTAISGHCDLLMLRHGEGDEDHADLTQITQNANRAAALVGQLLAFSRKQTLKMRPIDLRDALGDLAHLLNRLVGDRVTLRLEHDPALIPIRGDRRQLEQVIMNLVVNARDAMPAGGEILISTECRYLDRQMTRDRVSVPSGQYVVISVKDGGEGIPADNLTRIFEPFFTTKRPGEGTGLGLSMAYGIVKQSGGYIFADSAIGEGTCFSLYFPALSGGEESIAAVGPDEALRPAGDGATLPLLPGAPEDDARRLTVDDVPPLLARAESDAPPAEMSPDGGQDDADDPLTTGKDVMDRARTIAEAGLSVSDDAQASGSSEAGAGATEAPPDIEPEAREPGSLCAADPPAKRDESVAEPLEAPVREMLDGLLETDADASRSSAPSDPVTGEAPAVDDDAIAALVQETQPEIVEVDPEPDATEDADNPSDRRVVLLVEDEAPVRAFASRALRLRGYDVREAENAEAALAQLEDRELNVDLFVTDVMMPGLDGPSWVREAMKARPDVRTIFMSGYTQDALSETSVPVPNSVFLPKPFSLSDLTRTVERALD